MKTLMAISTLALFSGFALGDTISENGGAATFTNIPTLTSTPVGTGPYWNNHSGDFGGSNTADIGYALTNTGNFSSGTISPVATAYLSGPGSGDGTNDAAASFNLVHTTNSLIISLIGVTTGDLSNIFGIYDASKSTFATASATEIPLFGPGTLTVGTSVNESAVAFSNIGFYLIKSGGVTWFSNDALNQNGATGDLAGHQHFALFNVASNANLFYMGVEDWVTNAGEGVNGDYNDIIVSLNATASAVPEPATFALMGAGLLGLGYARFRSRKNRA